MKRKEAVYKGLRDIPVYFEDTSLTSPDYFQITEFPLRLTAGKDCLTVLDFVGNSRPEYNFENKFRALIGKTNSKISYSEWW